MSICFPPDTANNCNTYIVLQRKESTQRFISSGKGALKHNLSFVKGWMSVTPDAWRAALLIKPAAPPPALFRCRLSVPYKVSPSRGCPIYAICTLIWCVLPVWSSSLTREAAALICSFSILYALFIRRMSTKALTALIVLAGIGLASFAIFNFSGAGHLGVGWTMEEYNLIGGFLRVLFSFSMGLLMSRVFKPIHVKGAFWICSLAIVVLLSMPYVGNGETLWMNGIYDSVCAILIFPMLVYLGASGKTTDKHSARICKFLGDISYPLYMVHYPLIYLDRKSVV